jgi:hypothetical protein
MGLFTPKWKHKKWRKRWEWVENTKINSSEKQDILIYLITHDDNYSVRRIAAEKLMNDSEFCNSAINHSEYLIRFTAVKRIYGNDPYAAMVKIDDPRIIADIAKNDPSEKWRGCALHRACDQEVQIDEVLIDIVENGIKNYDGTEYKDSDPEEMISSAIQGIKDQKYLRKLLKDNNKYDAALSALSSDDSESIKILQTVAETHKDEYVREIAVKTIKNDKVLAEIANNCKDDIKILRKIMEKNDVKCGQKGCKETASHWCAACGPVCASHIDRRVVTDGCYDPGTMEYETEYGEYYCVICSGVVDSPKG